MPSISTDLSSFTSQLKHENNHLLFGQQMIIYRSKEEASSSFLICRIDYSSFSDPKFLELCSRVQIFSVFFLNTSSIFDPNDPNWIFYLACQNIKNEECYAPVGFATIYMHHGHSTNKRAIIKLTQSCVFYVIEA